MKIASLFSGCGGLDLGFTRAGFELVYANDNDPAVWTTFERNHKIPIDRRSLFDISPEEIPFSDGIIGGPPCQSWSLAGEMRGEKDERGKLFYKFIGILKNKQPKFFLAENVPGICSKTHIGSFNRILVKLSCLGYNLTYGVIKSADYGIPQERNRVIIVGYHRSLGIKFSFPPPTHSRYGKKKINGVKTEKWLTLRDAIGDLPDPVPALEKNYANHYLAIPNHEFMTGKYSYIYMSRDRRRLWSQPSWTIQASGRHVPLHPKSSKMIRVKTDIWTFKKENAATRRLSVREAARVQTFPDEFIFYYQKIADGYKMVGNAVPPNLAETIAKTIKSDIEKLNNQN